MMRRAAILAFVLLACPAAAEEPVPLRAAEIEALLSGNTVSGTWNDRVYRQFFDANGSTVYLESGAPESRGHWKVDTAENRYCSEWGSGVYSCYDVLSQGDRYLWRGESGHTESFSVLPGRQL